MDNSSFKDDVFAASDKGGDDGSGDSTKPKASLFAGFENDFMSNLTMAIKGSVENLLGDNSSAASEFEYMKDQEYFRGSNEEDVSPLSQARPSLGGSTRDYLVKHIMTKREDEFTDLTTFKIFIGTWNVNGQPPTIGLQNWLSQGSEPPDVYAVGFQELDLSKEAFLFSDSPREAEWYQAVKNGLHPRGEYAKVRLVRLVGMMLIVFIHVKHAGCIQNVDMETVGTGIMGKMGNKGGVAVRLELHQTSVCLVNSHLAAHVEEYERRNQDYNDICSRLSFGKFDPPLSIHQHDAIFWLGDLNYRLHETDVDRVKKLIALKSFSTLLKHDQLYTQRSVEKKIFCGYVEGEVTFVPTYKYDPNSDNWDTSEKCRVPAWCDRILYKGSSIAQLRYQSHPSLRISDHKPVSAIFNLGVKVIDDIKYKRVYEEVQKQLDKMENEYLPQVTLDRMEVQFSNVMVLESQSQAITVANTGQVPVQFEFIKKPNMDAYSKSWLQVTPSKSFINIGETCEVKLDVYIDGADAGKLNSGRDTLHDILVLHLEGGKDIFVIIDGEFIPSCFGLSIETLCHLHQPIEDISATKLIDMEKTEKERPADVYGDTPPFDIPKELWIMMDHLYKYGLKTDCLFQQPGLHFEVISIRKALDSGAYSPLPGSVHSVAEATLNFLEALPEAVIPASLYHRCIQYSSSFQLCKQVLVDLPEHHKNVFKYVTAFLRQLLCHAQENQSDAKTLAVLFGGIFLREPEDEPKLVNSPQQQQAIERKKGTFVYHFLINEYDE